MLQYSQFAIRNSRLFALFFFIGLFEPAFAQQSFISSFSDPSVVLTAAEKTDFDRYANFGFCESSQLVQFSTLRTIQQNGVVSFNLPNSTTTYQMRVQRAEYVDDANYVWEGSRFIEGDSTEFPDYMLLVMENNLLIGEIVINQQHYRIFPINQTYQVLAKVHADTSHGGCGNVNEGPPSEEGAPCNMTDDACFTDVLIFYTEEVAGTHPNISAIGRLAYEQLNRSFSRSKIKQRVRLVGIELWPEAWINKDADDEIIDLKIRLAVLVPHPANKQ